MSTASEEKESTTISMVVEKWEDGQTEQISPVHRIGGYPWRLQIMRDNWQYDSLYLICDKSSEAQLWQCTATINIPQRGTFCSGQLTHTFSCWDERTLHKLLGLTSLGKGSNIVIDITISEDGSRWRHCSVVKPCMYDAILLVGDEKRKIHVNKKSLTSQSLFFDRLFYGDFKEKNMEEIPIGDVEFDEFSSIVNISHCNDSSALTDNNVHRMLALADRFEMKIVEDSVVSYLLSPSCSLSLTQKIIIADQYNLPFLLDHLDVENNIPELKRLIESPAFEQLSIETFRILFEKLCG